MTFSFHPWIPRHSRLVHFAERSNSNFIAFRALYNGITVLEGNSGRLKHARTFYEIVIDSG